VRKGQVIDVKWEDLDLDVVPLSRQAIAVIERMRDRHQRLGIEIKPDGYIFPSRPGSRKGHADQASVNNFMRLTLKRKDITLHGFRTAEGADLSDREVLGAVHAAIFRSLILIIFSIKLLELARSARRVTDQTLSTKFKLKAETSLELLSEITSALLMEGHQYFSICSTTSSVPRSCGSRLVALLDV
jgi:hypothetical protein